jgi:hypothetical protein
MQFCSAFVNDSFGFLEAESFTRKMTTERNSSSTKIRRLGWLVAYMMLYLFEVADDGDNAVYRMKLRKSSALLRREDPLLFAIHLLSKMQQSFWAKYVCE